MNVEEWTQNTGDWLEGIATGLIISIIPLFCLGLAVGISMKVLTKPIEIIGGV